jgi:hypothetical protein
MHAHEVHAYEVYAMRYTPMRCTPVRCTLMRCMPVRYTPMRHAYKVYPHEMYTYEIHVLEIHAYEMHDREVHAYEGHAFYYGPSSHSKFYLGLTAFRYCMKYHPETRAERETLKKCFVQTIITFVETSRGIITLKRSRRGLESDCEPDPKVTRLTIGSPRPVVTWSSTDT